MSEEEKEDTSTVHIMQDDEYMTSHQIGALIQVNPSSVNKWSKSGVLRGEFRTPGGHRRFQARDVATFLVRYKMPIPRSLQSVAAKVDLNTCG